MILINLCFLEVWLHSSCTSAEGDVTISWAVEQDGEEMIGQDCGLSLFFFLDALSPGSYLAQCKYLTAVTT